MEKITLRTTHHHQSDIFIDTDFTHFNTIMQKKNADERSVFAIVDEKVDELYGSRFPFPKMTIKADEAHKTLETVELILHWLMGQGAGREALLLGVGGGVTTDVCGFAAAIYKRGIDCAFVPTTLLAMIDASIGGKNGVNVLGFKNMAGTVRQPKWVFASCDFLRSFSQRALYKSLPEMFKVFLIKGEYFHEAADFFAKNDVNAVGFFEKMQFFITEAVRIKCGVVTADEFEEGRGGIGRRILNLGHTFAHAIEHCTARYSHGEAVGIGLVEAAKNGHCDDIQQIENALKACGLPYQLPEEISVAEMKSAIFQDKKNTNGLVNLIVLEAVGKIRMQKTTMDEIIF